MPRPRLAALVLPAASGGAALDVRPSRGPRVLVKLHDGACSDCHAYVAQIAARADAIAEWGADVVVISATAVRDSAGLPVLIDAAGAVVTGRLDVVVADEWGEIFHATEGGGGVHDVIAADEVVEWVKFVAIQCPECENPEGPWRDL